MAIKANASSQGGEFKKFVGVGSFRVLGVNPSKAELEEFYGRTLDKEPEYLKDKTDGKDNNKPYKSLRVCFMIQADKEYEDGKEIKENAVLAEPLKTTVNFFIDSRYFYNNDKTKVQVIDKYGRTAWVTIEQCKNHQIPVYSNGPAKLDADYRPAFRGEAELTEFILNYLNVTPIDTYNSNTGQWMTNPHPEDCEGRLDKIKDYFTGNVSELKEFCTYMPTNRIKLLMGVEPDDQGRLNNNIYTRLTARNGAKSYTRFKDAVDGDRKYAEDNGRNFSAVYSNDPIGVIKDLEEYNNDVKETNLNSAPATSQDPFAQAAALPEDDLPFGPETDQDPFANS
jgi:hypothetical protein